VLNPFYIFQVFSMILWFSDGYRLYASCILFISVVSVVVSLVETRKNLKNIRKMAYYSCPVNVMRSSNENALTQIESNDLIPGDVIEMPEYCFVPCDLILLQGSCVVNEAMLTGESIPVVKSAIPFNNDIYDTDAHAKHTFYGGTKII